MKEMSPDEPCPYCDSKVFGKDDRLLLGMGTEVAVMCMKCGVRGPWAKNWNLAVMQWDTLPREGNL